MHSGDFCVESKMRKFRKVAVRGESWYNKIVNGIYERSEAMVVHGAVIIEQGVTFAIVVVKPEVTQYTVRATRFRQAIRPYFPNMPIILMSQDKEGKPHYYGRKDVVEFLREIPLDRIPWKTYHIY